MLDHDVHIWFRPTDTLDEAASAAAASVLSDDELAQYRRFHFPRDARDYAAAHALLRHALSRYDGRAPTDWLFEKTPAGQPLLRDAGAARASFSLSHTHGMVACAVTKDAAVGVDVERVDREVDAADIAARFFAPAEAAHLMQLDPEARRDHFFDLWTLKEALVKALGVGMAMSLRSLAFSIAPDRSVRLDAPEGIDTEMWRFGLFAPGTRHRMAVAARRLRSGPAQFVVRSFTEL